MEAIKTILDIQASQLTLVSPKGVLGGRRVSICVTPPSHCKSQKKALEWGCRKVKAIYIHSSQVILTAFWEYTKRTCRKIKCKKARPLFFSSGILGDEYGYFFTAVFLFLFLTPTLPTT